MQSNRPLRIAKWQHCRSATVAGGNENLWRFERASPENVDALDLLPKPTLEVRAQVGKTTVSHIEPWMRDSSWHYD